MKRILYLTITIVCLSVYYACAQPAEYSRIDLASQPANSLSLNKNTCNSHHKKHGNGWHVGEYMMLGGGVLAMAGGVMLYDNRNIITYNQQPADFIALTGAIIFGIGLEVFGYSFRSEYGWGRRFVLKSERNRLGLAYNF